MACAIRQQRPLGTLLVTGAAGLVGSALVSALLDQSAELEVDCIIAADLAAPRDPSPSSANRSCKLTHIVLDVSDPKAVEIAFSSHKPDTVFHVAAVIDIRPEADRHLLDAVNCRAVGLILAAAESNGASTFVHFSTMDAAYPGKALCLHVAASPGDLCVKSSCHYVRSKALGEALAMKVGRSDARLDVVVLRPSHVYSRAKEGASGRWKDPVAQYMSMQPAIQFGPTSKMSMVSDVTVAEAAIRAAKKSGSLRGQCYQLKEFDVNFWSFYQEQILCRTIVLTIPAGLILFFAWISDFLFWWLLKFARRSGRTRVAARCPFAQEVLSQALGQT